LYKKNIQKFGELKQKFEIHPLDQTVISKQDKN